MGSPEDGGSTPSRSTPAKKKKRTQKRKPSNQALRAIVLSVTHAGNIDSELRDEIVRLYSSGELRRRTRVIGRNRFLLDLELPSGDRREITFNFAG